MARNARVVGRAAAAITAVAIRWCIHTTGDGKAGVFGTRVVVITHHGMAYADPLLAYIGGCTAVSIRTCRTIGPWLKGADPISLANVFKALGVQARVTGDHCGCIDDAGAALGTCLADQRAVAGIAIIVCVAV